MRSSVKYGLICSGLAIAAKLLLDAFHISNSFYSGSLNILMLLLAVFFGVRDTKFKENLGTDTTFKTDYKAAIQTVSMYSVVFSLFVFVYHRFINPYYFKNKIMERVELAKTVDIEQLIKNGTVEANITKEDYIQRVSDFSEMIFSPFSHASINLFGIIFLGAVYSVFMVWLIRKNPLVNR